MGEARGDLVRRGLVVGWRAAHRGCDERIAELQAISWMLRRRHVRKPCAVQSGHQEIPGAADAVAGEHAAGPVGAARRGSETDDEQARAGIAEAGNRFAPIEIVAVGAPLFARDLSAVSAKPRTAIAADDRVARLGKGKQTLKSQV